MTIAPTLEAERAEFEAWASNHLGQGYPLTMDEHVYEHPVTRWTFKAWQAARTATPVPADVALPLDAEGLPPLPDGYAAAKFAPHTVVYPAEQVRQAQRDAVEADRRARGMVPSQVRVPKQSIDTPEFRALVEWWAGAAHSCDKHTRTVRAKAEWAKLIAYIDGRTAGAAPEGWKLVPVEPTQAMNTAGYMRNLELGGAKRSADETYRAMIAVAPSPLPPKEEDK